MSIHIAMHSGALVDILNPEPDSICFDDIARGLSWLPRYRAQTATLYSVAAHCVSLAKYVQSTWPPGTRNTAVALYALLHDATEAYVGDLPYPVRELAPAFTDVERRLFEVIWRRLTGLELPTPEEMAFVDEADRRIVGDEWRVLMPRHGTDGIPEPLGAHVYVAYGALSHKTFVGMAASLGIR